MLSPRFRLPHCRAAPASAGVASPAFLAPLLAEGVCPKLYALPIFDARVAPQLSIFLLFRTFANYKQCQEYNAPIIIVALMQHIHGKTPLSCGCHEIVIA